MNYSGLWEKREGRIICRAFAAWTELSDSSLAGIVAGYAGGGSFIQENFYCEFAGGTATKLIIDFTDHVSGEESSFDDLGQSAIDASEEGLDLLLDLHDQDAWEDREQLLLLNKAELADIDEADDLIKAGVPTPVYLSRLFDDAGLTAKPKWVQ